MEKGNCHPLLVGMSTGADTIENSIKRPQNIKNRTYLGKQWKLSDFILGGSKTTANGDCSHEIKRHLLLRRKVMTNLHSIFKSRDVTLLTKVRLVKAMVFPVVMYRCESCTGRRLRAEELMLLDCGVGEDS